MATLIGIRKENPKLEKWQVQQAVTAVNLYIHHFQATDEQRDRFATEARNDAAAATNNSSANTAQFRELYDKMREAIRIKHYAYSTEQSYLDWFKRFHAYAAGTPTQGAASCTYTAGDVKNYLAHLAMHHKVAASTQNQAFNALLFLFKNVLQMNVEGLDTTLRAKRGPKVPVVLSVEEMHKLLMNSQGINLLILQLLYGTGMRLMELARLRVKDLVKGVRHYLL